MFFILPRDPADACPDVPSPPLALRNGKTPPRIVTPLVITRPENVITVWGLS